MPDIADQAESNVEAFTREALYRHQQQKLQVEAVVECIHCEEFPAKVTATGLKLKYCERCIKELELTHL